MRIFFTSIKIIPILVVGTGCCGRVLVIDNEQNQRKVKKLIKLNSDNLVGELILFIN